MMVVLNRDSSLLAAAEVIQCKVCQQYVEIVWQVGQRHIGVNDNQHDIDTIINVIINNQNR